MTDGNKNSESACAKEVLAEEPVATSKDWENLCCRCGLCCFEKAIDGKGRIIETKVPCRHLDIHTRLCNVYEYRQQIESDCIKLTPEIIPELKWLPESCAYRKTPPSA